MGTLIQGFRRRAHIVLAAMTAVSLLSGAAQRSVMATCYDGDSGGQDGWCGLTACSSSGSFSENCTVYSLQNQTICTEVVHTGACTCTSGICRQGVEYFDCAW